MAAPLGEISANPRPGSRAKDCERRSPRGCMDDVVSRLLAITEGTVSTRREGMRRDSAERGGEGTESERENVCEGRRPNAERYGHERGVRYRKVEVE